MGVDVLLGLQWGDEGKGKVVDVLAPRYDIVARFQGGPNAGHTLEFGDTKHVLHQVPSGIFRDSIINVIGNGVVLDPVVFKKEIDDLSALGVDAKSRIKISDKATLILPSHKLLDKAQEESKGDKKIGSTLRGIGPAYQDKYGRSSLRIGTVLQDDFEQKLDQIMAKHQREISSLGGDDSKLAELKVDFLAACDFLREFEIVATEVFLNQALEQGKSILAEGAQGSLLDVNFGSYPYVTSSNTLSSGACSGLGVPPNKIRNVIGVFKAYCTRVGEGPFPSELFDEDGKRIAEMGHEFGATTGRPRRVGWLDLHALKYSCMLNGVTELYMMKADVLDGFEQIKVLEEYSSMPGGSGEVQDLNGDQRYIEVKGWEESVEAGESAGLSVGLDEYKQYIEQKIGIPIKLVSYGPKREESLWVE